eukprot:10320949-Lingulodinium_polyedra.AAC.1
MSSSKCSRTFLTRWGRRAPGQESALRGCCYPSRAATTPIPRNGAPSGSYPWPTARGPRVGPETWR